MLTVEQKIRMFRENIEKKLATTPAGIEHDRLSDALARLDNIEASLTSSASSDSGPPRG